MSDRAADPVCEDDERTCLAPQLVVGRVMPCHAFTDKLLLLARGERIMSGAQLERLMGRDVMFSNTAPQRLAPAIEERQRALGISPPSPQDAEDEEQDVLLPPTEPPEDMTEAAAPSTPLTVELAAARTLRRSAIRQVAALVEQARSGQTIDLQPVRGTVRHLVDSLRRNRQALASLVRLKTLDTYTYTHSINCCVLSVILAQSGGLAGESETIGLGALMHDIGKVRLPESLLHKPGSLSEHEWNLVRQHPLVGLEILDLSAETQVSAIEAIAQHHERLDGSGYPAGLSGAAVSQPGRIVAIADVYDAMTSDRPYSKAIQPPEAMRWIAQHAGQFFDPGLVRAFVAAIGVFPVGCLVRLSTGELGVVAGVNQEAILRPAVIVVPGAGGAPTQAPYLLDLGRSSGPGANKQIVGLEDPGEFAVDVDEYLTVLPGLSEPSYPSLDRLA